MIYIYTFDKSLYQNQVLFKLFRLCQVKKVQELRPL